MVHKLNHDGCYGNFCKIYNIKFFLILCDGSTILICEIIRIRNTLFNLNDTPNKIANV